MGKIIIKFALIESIQAEFDGELDIESEKIFYEFVEQKLPFIPTSMNNDRIINKIIEKLNLKFKVIMDNPEATKKFADNFTILKKIIKPIYVKNAGQYVPQNNNFTGLVSIDFFGFLNYKKKSIEKQISKVHLTNLTMTADFTGGSSLYSNSYIPNIISIELQGIVIQDFYETARKI